MAKKLLFMTMNHRILPRHSMHSTGAIATIGFIIGFNPLIATEKNMPLYWNCIGCRSENDVQIVAHTEFYDLFVAVAHESIANGQLCLHTAADANPQWHIMLFCFRCGGLLWFWCRRRPTKHNQVWWYFSILFLIFRGFSHADQNSSGQRTILHHE